MTDAPLFEAAGVDLEPVMAKPKRTRRPKPPTPAERAATGRLEGARRFRGPGQRTRIGGPRQLALAEVKPYPLHHNARLLGEVVARLPHGYAMDLNKVCAQQTREFQDKLMGQGVPKQSAWFCARTLVHHAYIKRVDDAHKEAGIL
ncbi:hypothetical protein MKK68_01035 [Methylobacterium sp. E-016]|uniref:hypothetical protein n=1 Tax=Methylobacterium sp. E-016 TaxID=2836556 RepID=UPI001FBB3DA5|nr:hypothetical protein [Methylobacterium sp. E-016]MCJ2074247.1 hypothetical protein [Methylobacterium sp. E-016]